MKFRNIIKSNKGVTGTDIVVAILVIMILSGVVANMFYQLYYNTSMIKLNAMAVNYAVNILEYTDKLSYADVNEELNQILKEVYDIPDNFDIVLDVEKYSDINPAKKDIIKILTLNINYTLSGNTENLTIKKLKIKEI